MTNRYSELVLRVVMSVALAVVLTIAASPSALAQGTSDADLRGYKGGLVEIGLKGGATVRGMLLSYTSEHVELEVTKGRMVKVHRSRLMSLKAAPAGASKSEPGEFPADAGMPYSAAARRATPATPPPSTDPRPAGPENPVRPSPGGTTAPGPARVTLGPGSKAKGLAFELKIGGTMYMPYATSGYHASTPVSADALLGYKFGRFLIGMRVDYAMVELSWEDASGDKMIGRMWGLLFAPTFQITLMESWPLSMYGTMSIDIGPGVTKDYLGDEYTIPIIGFRAGAGMRYFVHPRFAVGAEAGVRGFWMLIEGERLGNVNIYGQASLFFIW